MQCQAAALLREARRSAGISQRRLAIRAGTSQDAISRIERGVESPSVDRLAALLSVLGERLELGASPMSADCPEPPAGPRERLREAASWNLVATTLELAGAAARRADHPATRISP